MTVSPKISPLPVLCLIAFLDTTGFGIIIPIFLFYAIELGAPEQYATLFFAIYPVAVVIASPLLGLLSDRYGRRLILLACLFGAALGYLLLGVAESLWLLALARFIQGFMAGNIAVVQAYVADITDDQGRAAGMGKIGAAQGLGFVLGPAIGAWLGGADFASTSLAFAAYASAALSLLALVTTLLFLPESHVPGNADMAVKKLRLNPFASVPMAIAKPLVKSFFLLALLFNLAGAFAEVILPLYLKDLAVIEGPRDLMWIFLAGGLTLSLVQAKFIAPVNRRLGEFRMMVLGIAAYGVAFILLMFFAAQTSLAGTAFSWCIAGTGMAFFFTGIQSLVSKTADSHERGGVMGAFSAVGLLGRVAGPLSVGFIYAQLGVNGPYSMGLGFILFALLLCWLLRDKMVQPDTAASVKGA